MSEKGGKGIKSSPKSKDGGKNGNSEKLKKGRKSQFDPKEQEAWVLPLSQVIPKGKRSVKKRCKRVRENAETDDDDDMTIAERFNRSSKVDHYDDDDDTVLVKILPLSKVLEKLDDRMMNKRAHEDDENAETDDDDDNMTIAERFRSRKKRSDVENAKEERSSLEVNNKVSDNAKGERSGLEVDNNVSDLPQKLSFGDETVAATQKIEQKNDENKTSNGVSEQQEDDVVVDKTRARQQTEKKKDENNTSNGVAEQQDNDVGVDERLKQRKLAIWELELKMEERILKVENTLAKIKQWKLRQSHITPPAST